MKEQTQVLTISTILFTILPGLITYGIIGGIYMPFININFIERDCTIITQQPISYTDTVNGGLCSPSCHGIKSYTVLYAR